MTPSLSSGLFFVVMVLRWLSNTPSLRPEPSMRQSARTVLTGIFPCLVLAGCTAANSALISPEGQVLPRGDGLVVAYASGTGSLLGPFSTLRDDCSAQSFARIRVLQSPANGSLKVRRGFGNPAFPETSALARCNGKKVAGTLVDYTPRKGYIGPEMFQFEVIFDNGERRVLSPKLTIVQTP
jgi:hypothetical protein